MKPTAAQLSATASEINKRAENMQSHMFSTLEEAANIGEMLIGVREHLRHGEFLLWINANLKISKTTVYRCISVCKSRDKIPKLGSLDEAYKLISSAKIDTTDPIQATPETDLEPATELPEIPTKLTPIKSPERIGKASEPEPEVVYDLTGYPIPDSLIPLWNRREEVIDMVRKIAGFTNKLEEVRDSKDILWKTCNFGDARMALQNAHQEIAMSQIFAVCTTCQGHKPERCAFCKGRGFLSKFIWNSAVPEELKSMRGKKR